MRRIGLVLLASLFSLVPAAAMAATESIVAVDAKVLTNAKVERNGKHVGTVQRVMVNPTTGRIDHLHILMTEGQERAISVPWSGVKVYQDDGGHMTVSLTSRAAEQASPSASPASPRPAADHIRDAQRELRERGYYAGPVDGVVGPIMEAALRNFQRDQDLPVNGRLDARTAQALASDKTAAATRSAPSASPMTDSRTVQRELRSRGYYRGPIDGVIGPATEAALRGYQRDHGLTVTGRLDSRTLRSLSLERS